MNKKFWINLLVGVALVGGAISTIPEAQATGVPVVVTASAPETTHQATNLWGHITNWGQWLDKKVRDLNDYIELVENNFLTEAIRGFNELMTAIQTDISEVLGTVETLVQTPMDILSTVMEIPNSIYGMLGDLQGTASRFMGVYDDAMGIFGMVGQAQAFGDDIGGLLEGAGGAYGFMNQVGGMRTSLNSSYLGGSRDRASKLNALGKSTYGRDAIQLQSSQIDIQLEMLRQQYRAEEMAALDRVYQASERMAIDEQLRANTSSTMSQTANWFRNQLR